MFPVPARRLRHTALPIMLVTAVLAGCSGVATPPPPQRAAPAAAVDQRLVQAGTRFSFNLLHSLRSERPGENLFISPASASLALSLTFNGARGETQQAMARALSLEGLAVDEVNRENGALQTILANPDPKVQLSIANSIWYQAGHEINPAFLEVSREHYRAEVQAADFAGPDAANSINGWVARATNDRIKSIVERTKPGDRMYLVNAIYFYGTWKSPFDPAATAPRPFHLPNGTAREHPMMTQQGRFRHVQGDSFQAIALPYGEGRLSMYVFLPDEGVPLDSFLQGLTAEQWETFMGQFSSREGTITLPKVRLSYEAELSQSMTALGMGIAFDDAAADFGNLFQGTAERLVITSILQKTYLDLNEKGTEAAAVTSVTVGVTSAPAPGSRFDMVVDRPYFIAIRDDKTGALLFLGTILDPQ